MLLDGGANMIINLNEIKKKKGYTFEFPNQPVVDGDFVKKLREKLKMTQSMFAELLNVKKKTVEKWEQGKNPISNGNAVAMIIFFNHPEIVNDFIKIGEPKDVLVEMEFNLDDSCLSYNSKNKKNVYSNARDVEHLQWLMQNINNRKEELA